MVKTATPFREILNGIQQSASIPFEQYKVKNEITDNNHDNANSWHTRLAIPGLASHTRSHTGSHEAAAKGRAATSSQGVQIHRDTVKVGPHSVATFEKTPLLFHPCSLWRCEGLQCLRHFCAECAITTGWKIRPPHVWSDSKWDLGLSLRATIQQKRYARQHVKT